MTTEGWLYELLPAVHRLADADQEGLQQNLPANERHEPLRQLLTIIETHLAALQEDADRLYDDQFIETCAEWLTPYIGELIGYRPLNNSSADALSFRAEVANTIRYRRRKGTAVVLEQLARDVTGWDARVLEFFERLTTTQYMNHRRPQNLATANLRDWEALERRDTAFAQMTHTAEVRRIQTTQARFNIPNVGLYVWRLKDYRLYESPAVRIDNRRFVFSPLGNDTPLFTAAVADEMIQKLSAPINVPEAISYRVLVEDFSSDAASLYYGENLSIHIRTDGVDTGPNNIRICNLSDLPSPPAAADVWARTPLQVSAAHPETVAVDPVLGRIAFADPQPANGEVLVTYHYAFSAPIGGGQYLRRNSFLNDGAADVEVPHGGDLQAALDAQTDGGLIEIVGNARFVGNLAVIVNDGTLELRAEEDRRPCIVVNQPINIVLADDATLILNGLLISGGHLNVSGKGRLLLKHCTLVPGIELERGGDAVQPGAPSIVADDEKLVVEISDSIVGPVLSHARSELNIRNTIVDAGRRANVALAAPDGAAAGAPLTTCNCSIVGKVHAQKIQLASNTLFDARLDDADAWTAPVRSVQTQEGCIRFSYVPPESITPRRHRCQPDLALKNERTALLEENPAITAAELAISRTNTIARVAPAFVSRRYGDAAYMQLNPCVVALPTGADDESEMGAFHDVYAPQRIANLRSRLEEYLRFRLEAGVFRAS